MPLSVESGANREEKTYIEGVRTILFFAFVTIAALATAAAAAPTTCATRDIVYHWARHR